MATKAALLAVLQRHIGAGQGLACDAIARDLGCEARHIRVLVTELRMDGIALCGTPRDGYFIASTAEELEHTLAFLRSRAMHSLVLESKLRHLPLRELLGQIRIDT